MDTATVQRRWVEAEHWPSFLILVNRAFIYTDNMHIPDLILKLYVFIVISISTGKMVPGLARATGRTMNVCFSHNL